jgi:hypothetical protein
LCESASKAASFHAVRAGQHAHPAAIWRPRFLSPEILGAIPFEFNFSSFSGLHMMGGVLISEELAWGCSGISTAIEANNLGQVFI